MLSCCFALSRWTKTSAQLPGLNQGSQGRFACVLLVTGTFTQCSYSSTVFFPVYLVLLNTLNADKVNKNYLLNKMKLLVFPIQFFPDKCIINGFSNKNCLLITETPKLS